MANSKIKEAAISAFVKTSRPLLRKALTRMVTDSAICRLRQPKSHMAWQVAMPKSGSTWVHRVLANCLQTRGWKSSKFFSYSEYREQVIDPRSFLLEKCLDQSTYGLQQHCLFSGYTHKIICQYQIRVILQVRDIFDCLVSLSDHYEISTMMPMAPLTTEQWAGMDPAQREMFLAEIIAPWYIRFWVSWSRLALEKDNLVKLVRYESLIEDPVTTFTQLAQHCDPLLTSSDITECLKRPLDNTRKNVGLIGRGQCLSEQARQHIRKLAGYYPDVDFGPIGL